MSSKKSSMNRSSAKKKKKKIYDRHHERQAQNKWKFEIGKHKSNQQKLEEKNQRKTWLNIETRNHGKKEKKSAMILDGIRVKRNKAWEGKGQK
ncbi:hypothetical protein RFI_18607 [Reticulomyxa filosa]|uniref:Uncharacterized protein n=1 Tax=Reticulomyxa filosa TaxID=46433 RepID=X6MXT8_RETFI|nr:hypothetical protein RFI_18607 [Reticulomyxa filosa]|eukprot:ETO18656.1 hypothetical protein RFI_18607 [Reticulomyxa filosa]